MIQSRSRDSSSEKHWCSTLQSRTVKVLLTGAHAHLVVLMGKTVYCFY